LMTQGGHGGVFKSVTGSYRNDLFSCKLLSNSGSLTQRNPDRI
jgi:hypothetical protein